MYLARFGQFQIFDQKFSNSMFFRGKNESGGFSVTCYKEQHFALVKQKVVGGARFAGKNIKFRASNKTN